MTSLSLPMHRRPPIRGPRLFAIWGGLVVGSWVAAYLFARLVLWAAHAIGALF